MPSMGANRHSALCTALAVVAALEPPLSGWNSFGHMTVAALAWQSMGARQQARASALLQLNPEFRAWLNLFPPGPTQKQAQQMLFCLAATWADRIKGDPGYMNDGAYPSGTTSSQNVGYPDHLHHAYWHFVEMPFSPDKTPLRRSPSPNAQTQIAAFRTVIASNAPDSLKSYDLVWLIHLVGDVHQPLHCATRCTRDLPYCDAGGNRLPLCAPPCRENLHALWDDILGTSTEAARAVQFAASLNPPDATKVSALDESLWVKESFELAKAAAYAPIGIGKGPVKVTAQYRNQARDVARRQVALAGARLAAVLNHELE